MKATLLLLALANVTLAAPTMTDRITPAEIAARQKSASPLAAIPQPAAATEAPVVRPGDQSLIKQSDILNDGIHWTIVPKGAVLHVPPAFAARVGAKPVGTLLPWIEFLTVNRNWLFTEEVTFDHAAGKKPLPPSRLEAWQKFNKVVVAVHLGGPISVRTQPPATPVASTR
ncbi:hypothetical protein OKA05_26610 [Luteolibacter arcticus]|uniref:Uncharacterized protein n=1 Tax=Luteolibacter arcticus TaxID=1581411 RepID=A0ABT3GRK3_9BACT|nr:hypothetical protein [Luteolibacter arcticus]MCW1926158.1 hypothetical protein [Luteolibacter arcticus]